MFSKTLTDNTAGPSNGCWRGVLWRLWCHLSLKLSTKLGIIFQRWLSALWGRPAFYKRLIREMSFVGQIHAKIVSGTLENSNNTWCELWSWSTADHSTSLSSQQETLFQRMIITFISALKQKQIFCQRHKNKAESLFYANMYHLSVSGSNVAPYCASKKTYLNYAWMVQ